MRLQSSGGHPTFALLELATGAEVPDAEPHRPAVLALTEMAIMVAALDNDRHSLHKELSRGQADQNVYTVLTAGRSLSMQEAVVEATSCATASCGASWNCTTACARGPVRTWRPICKDCVTAHAATTSEASEFRAVSASGTGRTSRKTCRWPGRRSRLTCGPARWRARPRSPGGGMRTSAEPHRRAARSTVHQGPPGPSALPMPASV